MISTSYHFKPCKLYHLITSLRGGSRHLLSPADNRIPSPHHCVSPSVSLGCHQSCTGDHSDDDHDKDDDKGDDDNDDSNIMGVLKC